LGTAFGTFLGLQSITLMLASILAGMMWSVIGAENTFLIVGCVTIMMIVYFLSLKNPGQVALPFDNPDPLED
jgi:MFS superfamily sulfate permease-like transporter